MKNCGNCKYEKEGVCRRFPPHVFPMQAKNALTGQVEMQVIALPVQAHPDNWCGEYKEMEKKLASVN